MPKKASRITVRFRIDLSSDHSIGPGKIELLETLQRSETLRQAAQKVGLSYKVAWYKLDSINRGFKLPATTRSATGLQLTAWGEEVIRRYRSLAEQVERIAHKKFDEFAMQVAPPSSRGTRLSRNRLPPRSDAP